MPTGPFWDAMEGRTAPSSAAVMLGFELRRVDPEAMTLEAAFLARPEFTNLVGDVQGGILAAMLDTTLGAALVATLTHGEWAPTTDLHVQFLAPARPGPLLGRGRVTKRGGSVGFLAGELMAPDDTVVASAIATASIRRRG